MEETALVSIVCLSFNHENYIKKGLASLVNQTYKNFEIIYLDNSSSDNSFEIATAFLAQSNATYTTKRFDENIGCPKAFNYAIKHLIKGDYVCIMALDDWLEEKCIAEKMEHFKLHPACGVVYSYGYYYFEEEDKTVPVALDSFKEGMIFNELLKQNFVFTMGSIIKKEVYDIVGLYNEENSIEDWEFSLRVAQKYPFGLVKKPHFYYRKHSSNYSIGSKQYYQDSFKVLAPYKKHENYKIGYQWINTAYINFIYDNKANFSDFLYLLKHIKLNRQYIKRVLKYFINLCLKTN